MTIWPASWKCMLGVKGVDQPVGKAIAGASLGLEKPAAVDRRADFEDLFGGWSEEEEQRFKRLADLEQIAPDEW